MNVEIFVTTGASANSSSSCSSTLVCPFAAAAVGVCSSSCMPCTRKTLDAQAAEVFGGMRIVRAFGRQRTETARFVAENDLLIRQETYAWW